MFNQISRKIMSMVAENQTIRKITTKYGMSSESGFARRFVSGETLDEAVEAVKKLNEKGISATLDLLGESVNSIEDTQKARDKIIETLDAIHTSGIDSNVSIKLTQLGLDIDDKVCRDNVETILLHAQKYDNFIRIDMESSDYTQRTLDIFQYLFKNIGNNVGIVLQSYLYRTEYDVRELNKLGAGVRLCKGAYLEPKIVAFRKKRLVDENYLRCIKLLFAEGKYPAVATHDENIITKAKEYAEQYGIKPDQFEIQMLYGIRRDLQEQIVKEGYRMRAYVPYGTEWFPYFTRRLGERMGNVMFMLKSLYRESGDGYSN
ncbi:hypothetical protein AMJ80_10485 [bacterium SM23_31]|nr:MAG: hypothetical protein AMJ80_10485 [bacterium SM23_31]